MLSSDKLYRLKKHLISSINKKISRSDCSDLINISKSIVIPYLLNAKSSFIKLNRIHGLDVIDISIEVLGEVLRQDEEGTPVNIKNFVSKLNTDINLINEENLFWAYQSFLRKMTNVHIAHSFAELDPNGFKIQRNIKETLPTETLEIRKNILGEMIFVKGSEEFDRLPYLSIEEVEKDFLIAASGKTTTKSLLEVVHSLLIDNINSRKEININDAVRIFKRHFGIDQIMIHEEDSFEMLLSNSFIDKLEIDLMCAKVIEKIRGKIFIDYFSKGKLNIEQARVLDCTVNDIIHDLVNMGKNHISFYDYLNKYMKIEHAEYELKFKSKLEYFVKQIKQDFRNYFYTKE